MLSLGNAFDKGDLENFEKKIFNFLSISKKEIEYSVEPKLMVFQLHCCTKMENLFKDYQGVMEFKVKI